MPTTWFVLRGDEVFGPYTGKQLRTLVREGKVRRTHLIRKEGTERWVPADGVHGLYAVPVASPADSTPAPATFRMGPWILASAVIVAVAVAGSATAVMRDKSPQALVGNPPTQSHEPSPVAYAPSVDREREKLQAERLELERQRIETEKRKREELEEQSRKNNLAEKAQEFSDTEFTNIRDAVTKRANSLGESLLSGTHPTGTYTSTATPVVTLSADRRDIAISIEINWTGFSGTPYQTEFATNLNKKEGMGALVVERDTAIFKIDPGYLRRAESILRETLRNMFKLGRRE